MYREHLFGLAASTISWQSGCGLVPDRDCPQQWWLYDVLFSFAGVNRSQPLEPDARHLYNMGIVVTFTVAQNGESGSPQNDHNLTPNRVYCGLSLLE
jgi:hypothetical protein